MNIRNSEVVGVVRDNENFLEGINLVTGDKINYCRHLLSNTQIDALCVEQKQSPTQKCLHLLAHGEAIQKWAMLQNLPRHIQTSVDAEAVFTLIEKNYTDYEGLQAIMGEGVRAFLKTAQSNLELMSLKTYDTIFRLLLRTTTAPKNHGSEAMTDWMTALGMLMKIQRAEWNRGKKLKEVLEFTGGSFSMTTLPQRRKCALMMMEGLLGVADVLTNQQSQQVLRQAHNSILFFNNDTNPSTRLIICNILHHLLSRQSDSQLWKIVTDYHIKDQSPQVRERALSILTSLHHSPNAEHLLEELSNQNPQSQLLLFNYAPKLFRTFGNEIRVDRSNQLKVVSFLNRMLRRDQQQNLEGVLKCYSVLSNFMIENILIKQLELRRFDLENMKVVLALIRFYGEVGHLDFKEEIKKQAMKGIRYHQFELTMDRTACNAIIAMLDYSVEEDLMYFTQIFLKLIDNSHWRCIAVFLQQIPQVKFYQSQFDKVSQGILKLYLNCPYCLLDPVHQVILYFCVSDRKNMELLGKVREKCGSSRCWAHRRNYLKLYSFLRRMASHDFGRTVPLYPYKTMLFDKSTQIKLQFVKQIQLYYPFLDPGQPAEKQMIKEIASKMAEDKDKQLASAASQAIAALKDMDRDYNLLNHALSHSKEMLEKEEQIQQVQSQTRKHIKTEKHIRETIGRERNKQSQLLEQKNAAKLITISNAKGAERPVPGMMRSSSTQQAKKELPKFSLPVPKKRTRF